MKGWQLGLVGVAVIGAAGAAGAPFLIGMQAEKRFGQALQSMNQPGGPRLTLVSYKRGWFGGEAVSRIEFPGSGADASFELIHTVAHGPFLPSRALFEVNTVPRLTGDAAVEARTIFGDKPPFTSRFLVNMSGAQRLTFDMPAVNTVVQGGAGEKLDFSGLHAEIEVPPGNDRASGTLESARLSVDGRPENSVNLAGLRGRFQSELREGLWVGSADFTLDSMALPGGNNRVEKVGISGAQKLDGGKVGFSWSLTADKIVVDGAPWGRAEYSGELTNLDLAAIKEFQARTEKLASLPADQIEMQMQALLMEMTPKLLSGQPRFAIPKLLVETPKGPVAASLNVTYKGAGNIANPDALMKDLTANAELSVPRALAEEIAGDQLRGEILMAAQEEAGDQELTAEQTEALVLAAVGQRIDELVAQQMVVVEGKQLKSRARFEQGKLFVNDQMLMDMAGGMAGGALGVP